MDPKRYRFSNTGHTQNVGSRYFMVWLYWICIDIDRIRYQHLYWFSPPFPPCKKVEKDMGYIPYLFHRDISHFACIFTIHEAYGTVVGDITSHIKQ